MLRMDLSLNDGGKAKQGHHIYSLEARRARQSLCRRRGPAREKTYIAIGDIDPVSFPVRKETPVGVCCGLSGG
jgi:hypothetical protein